MHCSCCFCCFSSTRNATQTLAHERAGAPLCQRASPVAPRTSHVSRRPRSRLRDHRTHASRFPPPRADPPAYRIPHITSQACLLDRTTVCTTLSVLRTCVSPSPSPAVRAHVVYVQSSLSGMHPSPNRDMHVVATPAIPFDTLSMF